MNEFLSRKFEEGKSFKFGSEWHAEYISVGWLIPAFDINYYEDLQDNLNKYLGHPVESRLVPGMFVKQKRVYSANRYDLVYVSLWQCSGDIELLVSPKIFERIPEIIKFCLNDGYNVELCLKERTELRWNDLNHLSYLNRLKKSLKGVMKEAKQIGHSISR